MGVSVTTLVVIKAYMEDKITKEQFCMDYLEFTHYYNIILLTVATSYYLKQPEYQITAATTSMSLALVMFLCILLYHSVQVLQKIRSIKTLTNVLISKKRHFSVDKDQYHLSLIFPQEAEMNSVEVTTVTHTSSVVSLSPQHKLQDEDDSHCDVNNSIQIQHDPISIDQSSQSA